MSRAYSNIVETMELETGDTADYRTTSEGIELEVLDADEKRLAMLFFRWDEVAPLLRGLYARQLDGFGQERPEPTAETPLSTPRPWLSIRVTRTICPMMWWFRPCGPMSRSCQHLPPRRKRSRMKCWTNTLHPFGSMASGRPSPMQGCRGSCLWRKQGEPAPHRREFPYHRRSPWRRRLKAKFQANVAAIKLLKYLEETTGQATPEQQQVLSRYVGWGGIPQAFDAQNEDWRREYAELKALLSETEYMSARASTLNAHYTSPTVIRAIYDAVEQMGFRTGNILEPAMGVGNFFGLLPESMAGSRLYGVELDSLTGRIARQLYPEADITVAGFETTDRRDFFDLAVGNVPFGNYQVNDKVYNKLGFSIHNYFFAKPSTRCVPAAWCLCHQPLHDGCQGFHRASVSGPACRTAGSHPSA